MSLTQSLGIFLLFAVTVCQADFFEECNESNTGLYVTSNKSCAHYIACQGEDSFEGECAEGDYFHVEEQMCEPMVDVDCRAGVQTEAPISSLNTTLGSVEQSTANHTEASLTERPSTITPAPSTATAFPSFTSMVVSHTCPSVDDSKKIVLLANPKSCTDYFICYHGEKQPMSCAYMLHFNTATGKCDHAEQVKCLNSISSPREQCQTHIMDTYPHPDNCNYFYYCNRGFLMIQQCPLFYGWDYEKRSCVTLQQAKCFNRKRI